jgi:hypothetical protein
VTDVIPPLGGGAGLHDELLRCDSGALLRLQVLIDLHRIRPCAGTWYGYHCPRCLCNQTLHTFDYIMRQVDGTFVAICCHCDGEWTLYRTFDRTGGLSVGPQVMMKPATYHKPEADMQGDTDD